MEMERQVIQGFRNLSLGTMHGGGHESGCCFPLSCTQEVTLWIRSASVSIAQPNARILGRILTTLFLNLRNGLLLVKDCSQVVTVVSLKLQYFPSAV